MSSPEETNAGPVISDLRRIDPRTGQARNPGANAPGTAARGSGKPAKPGRHSVSEPGGSPGTGSGAAAQPAPDAAPAAAVQSDGEGSSNQSLSSQVAPSPGVEGQIPPGQTLEERVKNLRRQLEWLVKAPGVPLKSAPFHTASTLQSLPTGTEVLILISTPYWVGVETHEGQHGWIMRDELEQK